MSDYVDDLLQGTGADAARLSPESREGIRQRLLLRRDEVVRSRPRRFSWTPQPRPMIALACAAAVAAVAGFTVGPRLFGDTDRRPAAAEAPKRVPASSDTRVPEDTAEDIVTWADQVVLVTPISEAEVSGNARRTADGSGDGLVMRRLTIQVDATVWSRAGGASPGKQFEALDWGWVIKEGQMRPFAGPAGPRFVVGQQYVMTVAKDGAEWVIFGGASFPVRASEVAPAVGQDTPLARVLHGKSLTEFGSVLRRTSPDSKVAPFRALPFHERVQAYNGG